MGLPSLTGLQFFVIDCLKKSALKGHELRARLETAHIKKSDPAFYQLMRRMEKEGHTRSKTKLVGIGQRRGEVYREKTYWATAKGTRAHAQTRRFYASH